MDAIQDTYIYVMLVSVNNGFPNLLYVKSASDFLTFCNLELFHFSTKLFAKYFFIAQFHKYART